MVSRNWSRNMMKAQVFAMRSWAMMKSAFKKWFFQIFLGYISNWLHWLQFEHLGRQTCWLKPVDKNSAFLGLVILDYLIKAMIKDKDILSKEKCRKILIFQRIHQKILHHFGLLMIKSRMCLAVKLLLLLLWPLSQIQIQIQFKLLIHHRKSDYRY